eukprot:10313625-Heterocapsa_arctica.AAC.1
MIRATAGEPIPKRIPDWLSGACVVGTSFGSPGPASSRKTTGTSTRFTPKVCAQTRACGPAAAGT